jgi:hypothetical protein
VSLRDTQPCHQGEGHDVDTPPPLLHSPAANKNITIPAMQVKNGDVSLGPGTTTSSSSSTASLTTSTAISEAESTAAALIPHGSTDDLTSTAASSSTSTETASTHNSKRYSRRAHRESLQRRAAQLEKRACIKRAATTGTMSLEATQGYSLWYGEAEFGTPAQKVLINFDSGSADTVLNLGQFDIDNSTSAKATNKSFSISYADGTGVKGMIYNETVRVAGKVAKHQAIGAPVSSSFGASDPGLVGLGMQSISVFRRRPLVQTLFAEGSIPKAMFGVALARNSSKAEIRFGGYNSKKIKTGSNLKWGSVDTSSGFWVATADSISISRGSKQGSVKSASMIMDTGTTYIYGPAADVKALYKAAGVTTHQQDGLTLAVFTKLPSFTFNINGVDYDLKQHATTSGKNSNGYWYGSIIGTDDLGLAEGQWLVGDSFFQSVYSVFDITNERMGFAKPAF